MFFIRAPDAGGSVILSDTPSEVLPAELAPFIAEAQEQLEAATDGLQPAEAIQHLESTLAEAQVEASRLGIQIGPPAGSGIQATMAGEGDSQVVVIRQMVDPDGV